MIPKQVIEKYNLGPAKYVGAAFAYDVEIRDFVERPGYSLADCDMEGKPLRNKYRLFYLGFHGGRKIYTHCDISKESVMDLSIMNACFDILKRKKLEAATN